MKNISNDTRLTWIRKTVLFFFLIGIVLSFKLWTSDRVFPLLPVVDSIPSFNSPVDYLLLFLLILALAVNLFNWKNWVNVITLFVLVVLFMQDQNRWQPWAYIYFICLILFSLSQKTSGNKDPLFHFRLIIMGIYLWSGIHKLNTHFIDETVESILTDLFGVHGSHFINTIKMAGYIIPIVEISIVVFLFLPKLRTIGVYLALLTHVFILLYLSPLGINANSVVYPWNIAMIFMVVLLFYGTTGKINIFKLHIPDLQTLLVTFLIYIFPFLHFFGLWDNYLSFNLYSNKTNNYFIVIAEGQLNKVDDRLARYYLPVEGLKGGQIIDVGKWSATELNVPFYPETRTFKKVAKTFCRFGIADDQLYFLELSAGGEKGNYLRYTCNDLGK